MMKNRYTLIFLILNFLLVINCNVKTVYPQFELIIPNGFQADTFPMILKWENLEYYESYLIEIADNPEFDNKRIFATSEPELKLDTLHFDIPYFWKAQGLKNNDKGPWSLVHQFMISKELTRKRYIKSVSDLIEKNQISSLESLINDMSFKITIDDDLLRNAWFVIGKDYLNSNLTKAMKAFKMAIMTSPAKSDEITEILKLPLESWEVSEKDKAPGYEIAYMICCLNIRLGEIDQAYLWLIAALRMGYYPINQLYKDPGTIKLRTANYYYSSLFADIIRFYSRENNNKSLFEILDTSKISIDSDGGDSPSRWYSLEIFTDHMFLCSLESISISGTWSYKDGIFSLKITHYFSGIDYGELIRNKMYNNTENYIEDDSFFVHWIYREIKTIHFLAKIKEEIIKRIANLSVLKPPDLENYPPLYFNTSN